MSCAVLSTRDKWSNALFAATVELSCQVSQLQACHQLSFPQAAEAGRVPQRLRAGRRTVSLFCQWHPLAGRKRGFHVMMGGETEQQKKWHSGFRATLGRRTHHWVSCSSLAGSRQRDTLLTNEGDEHMHVHCRSRPRDRLCSRDRLKGQQCRPQKLCTKKSLAEARWSSAVSDGNPGTAIRCIVSGHISSLCSPTSRDRRWVTARHEHPERQPELGE